MPKEPEPKPWRDDEKPNTYDLVEVLYSDGKVQSAWWTGEAWDCGIQRSKNRITHWRPIATYERYTGV